jgi:hypothetical protein
MKIVVATLVAVMLFALMFSGCPSTKEIKKEEAFKPELTLTVASLNLASFNRRMEKKDVAALVRVLKREQVDILAVQSITRYPGLDTRLDFVKELSAAGDLRQAFGEMVNSGGKQTGNAVFSSFPMRSNVNVPFGSVKSAGFDAGILAIVDGGVRDIWIGSVQLPPKHSPDDAAACMRLVVKELPTEEITPMVLTGSLPEVEAQGRFSEFRVTGSKAAANRFWYTKQAGLEITGSRSAETDLGPLSIIQVGVTRQRRNP